MDLVQIRRRLQRPWQILWNSLPAGARHFLDPYYKKMFVGDRLNIVFWPTFRCNYSCSYCPIHTKFDFATIFPKAGEKTSEQWLEALDKLPPAVIYVAGGEPFLHPGLPDLLNNLPSKHRLLGIVTNLSMPHAIRRVKVPTHLNASLHRECVSTEKFIEAIKELQDSFNIAVNIVATPENLPAIAAVDKLLKSHSVSLNVDPFVDTDFEYSEEQLALFKKHAVPTRSTLVEFDDFSLKQCSAGRNYINLLPNGDVFTCASGFSYVYSPLFRHVVGERKTDHYRMGNLFDPAFSLNTTDISCTLPCEAYCDRDSALIKVIGPAQCEDTRESVEVNMDSSGTSA